MPPEMTFREWILCSRQSTRISNTVVRLRLLGARLRSLESRTLAPGFALARTAEEAVSTWIVAGFRGLGFRR